MMTLGATWHYFAAGFVLFVLVWALIYMIRTRALRRPGAAEAYVRALRSLLDGNLLEGARGLREAVSQNTDNVDAYVRLGDLLRESGRSKQALEVHMGLLHRRNLRREDEIRVKESIYNDYKYMGEPFRALEILKELLSRVPESKALRKELLTIYEKRSMWPEAVETKKKLVDFSSEEGRRKVAAYQANIGAELLKKGKREEALKYLKLALKAAKDCVPAWIALGDVSYAKDDVKDALAYWKKAIDISPRYAFLTIDRMEKALFHQGKYSETAELYQGFLDRNEENVSVHDALARIFVKMGETDRAISEYSRALEIDPDHLPARIGLARLYDSAGRGRDAFRELLSVVEGMDSRKKKYYCGSCGFRTSEFRWVCPKCGETESFS
jgi:lipopolysaccharide biosynthesis regulator YciM